MLNRRRPHLGHEGVFEGLVVLDGDPAEFGQAQRLFELALLVGAGEAAEEDGRAALEEFAGGEDGGTVPPLGGGRVGVL